MPKTELVEAPTDAAVIEPVALPRITVRTNEDLDRKALALETALGECNARLQDARASQGAPAAQPARSPWWRRLFGGES